MEYLFPKPRNSIVEWTPGNKFIRGALFVLILTSLCMAFMKYQLYGYESGLTYLIMVWFAYASWASLYFCNLLMFIITTLTYFIIAIDNTPSRDASLGKSQTLYLFFLTYYVVILIVQIKAYIQLKN